MSKERSNPFGLERIGPEFREPPFQLGAHGMAFSNTSKKPKGASIRGVITSTNSYSKTLSLPL
jgi:hypothetical protein